MSPLKILIIATTTLMPSLAYAEAKKVILKEMALNKTPLEGVSSAFISGTMDTAGTFAANAVMQNGSVFPAHKHPDDRMSLVVEGTMFLGIGDEINPEAEIKFEAGTVAVVPKGMSHWMAARDGDVRIIEIGTGPTVTEWMK